MDVLRCPASDRPVKGPSGRDTAHPTSARLGRPPRPSEPRHPFERLKSHKIIRATRQFECEPLSFDNDSPFRVLAMIVCVCHRVSDRAIAQSARLGLSFDDIQLELGVATQCGQCETCAREVWSECHPGHAIAHLKLDAVRTHLGLRDVPLDI
jgi:bacterioferritin-associated ferredoxin